MLLGLVLGIFAFYDTTPSLAGEPSVFVARGILVRDVYGSNESVVYHESRRFEFRLSDDFWLVRTEPVEGPPNQTDHWLVGSDGTNVYEVNTLKTIEPGFDPTNLPPEFVAKLSKKALDKIKLGRTNSEPSGIAYIYNGSIPEVSPSLAAPLWLAFGSAHHFKSGINITSAPCIWQWDYLPGQAVNHPTILAARGEILDGSLALPRHIVFGPALNDKDVNFFQYFEKAAKQVKQATAEYVVSGFTNVGGMSLPVEFTFKRFLLSSTRSKVYGVVQDIVTNTESFILMPTPQKGFTVSDHRLPANFPVPSIEYLADGPYWKPLSEVTNSIAYKRKVESFTHVHNTSKRNIFWRGVFIISVLLPLVVFILQKRK